MLKAHPSYPLQQGQAFPLGSHHNASGVNFALFSRHATRVELCIFDLGQEFRYPLYKTGDVWHGLLCSASTGLHYGYRVYGDFAPEKGQRFNPNKLLLDPYAKSISASIVLHESHFNHHFEQDSAEYSPKSVVISAPQPRSKKPKTPIQNSIIYELHTKGFTQLHPLIPETVRGTFLGLCQDVVIEHLKTLGVTAVELLPVHACASGMHLQHTGLVDYWGYNSVCFFAPEPKYGSIADFVTMVDKLHQHGLEVILDVVYNHSGEGSHFGPTLSFRGIDNQGYYKTMAQHPEYYYDSTGCGNTLNLDEPYVLNMVLDSLRYWANLGVDGFRLDLATSLARHGERFDPGHPFFKAVELDPVLSQCKMIAEPWDIGYGGYQVGHFPAFFHEWNDAYRDTMRRFWLGGENIGAFAAKFSGSRDMFHSRNLYSTVNFITAHDGFTLHDLACYNQKHNEANQENNHDGNSQNHSFNHGIEGASNDAVVQEQRKRYKRNMLTTLLLSHGLPMLTAGDELGRTQHGNNNAYCQDNGISWLDWQHADQELQKFVAQLIALRGRSVVFRPSQTVSGQKIAGDILDVEWLGMGAQAVRYEDWHKTTALGVLLSGLRGEEIEQFLIIFNPVAMWQDCLVPARYARLWKLLINTSEYTGWNGKTTVRSGEVLHVPPSSILVLEGVENLTS